MSLLTKTDLESLATILSLPISKLTKKWQGPFPGQWVAYALVYGVRALYNNVGTLLTREEFLQLAEPIVKHIMSEKMALFETKYWRSDVEKDFGKPQQHHLAMLSLRAWTLQMLKDYDESYNDRYLDYLDELADKYKANGKTFLKIGPRTPLFVPDNLLGVAVLANSPMYAQLAEEILHKHSSLDYTKILPKTIRSKKCPGSYAALSSYYLSLFPDKTRSRQQWEAIKKNLLQKFPVWGIKEHQHVYFGISTDGGPILAGASVIATAFSIGPAKIFGDKEIFEHFTKLGKRFKTGLKLVGLEQFAIVGPAVLYAMMSENPN